MDVHRNLYVGNPDNAQDVAAAGSLDRAVSLSNQATQAEAAGNVAQAIELHTQAAALKIRAFGEERAWRVLPADW